VAKDCAEAPALVSKRLRYQVAVSLDGFIAGPHGEYDWIVPDPSVDFAALYKQFDTVVMGRKTYEVMKAHGGTGAMPGLEVVVFSRTIPAAEYPGVRILNDDPRTIVAELKEKPGRDIWLFGGGELFRTLLDARLVNTVEVAVSPVLLAAGIPMLPPGNSTRLVLSDVQRSPTTGRISLAYLVEGAAGAPPRIRYIKPQKRRRKTTARGGKRRRPKRR
jgi:dihydrofolate reductase